MAAFPCNQFANEEPDPDDVIKHFAQDQYNATYDLYDKIQVNGPNELPLYTYLKANNWNFTGPVSWNFEKFLVNRQGKVTYRYVSNTEPYTIQPDIEKLLAEPVPPSSVSNDTPKSAVVPRARRAAAMPPRK